jgi:hypothetical protein
LLKASSLLSGLLLLLALLSCRKEPYQIGIDILPPTDTLGVSQTDTVTIIAYTVLQDSIRTDETTFGLLGAIMDPVFGKTTASVFTQVRLSTEGVTFGVNPVLDSVVLILYYDGYYGDTNTLQQVKVWELSQDLYTDSSYYSTQSAATYSILLADQYYKPRPKDSVPVLGMNVAPHLRINLSNKTNYLGNKVLSAPQYVLNSNDEFVKFIKGLYIQSLPVDEGGSFFKYKTTNLFSKLAVYYHNTDQGDTLRFDMVIDGSTARFTAFNHFGYADASPAFRQQVFNGDTMLGMNQLFIQAMAGARLKIHMPYLRSLVKDGKIAISNAQLVFENPEKDTTLAVPSMLSLYRLDSTGKVGLLADYNEGSSYFGGTYDEDTRTYSFRLTRHIQNILTGDTTQNPYLYISAVNPLVNLLYYERVVLNGTSPFNPSNRPGRLKLKLLYTKIR